MLSDVLESAHMECLVSALTLLKLSTITMNLVVARCDKDVLSKV